MELTIETIAEKLNSLYEEVVNQPVIYWVQNLRHPDYKLTAAISVVVQRDTNNQYRTNTNSFLFGNQRV